MIVRPAGGVSPLNLDRLTVIANGALIRPIRLRGDGDGVRIAPSESLQLAEAVLALVARVRELEAVTQAARREVEAERQLDDSLHAETRDHLGRCTVCMDAEAEALSARNALRSALAVVDGGGADE